MGSFIQSMVVLSLNVYFSRAFREGLCMLSQVGTPVAHIVLVAAVFDKSFGSHIMSLQLCFVPFAVCARDMKVVRRLCRGMFSEFLCYHRVLSSCALTAVCRVYCTSKRALLGYIHVPTARSCFLVMLVTDMFRLQHVLFPAKLPSNISCISTFVMLFPIIQILSTSRMISCANFPCPTRLSLYGYFHLLEENLISEHIIRKPTTSAFTWTS